MWASSVTSLCNVSKTPIVGGEILGSLSIFMALPSTYIWVNSHYCILTINAESVSKIMHHRRKIILRARVIIFLFEVSFHTLVLKSRARALDSIYNRT